MLFHDRELVTTYNLFDYLLVYNYIAFVALLQYVDEAPAILSLNWLNSLNLKTLFSIFDCKNSFPTCWRAAAIFIINDQFFVFTSFYFTCYSCTHFLLWNIFAVAIASTLLPLFVLLISCVCFILCFVQNFCSWNCPWKFYSCNSFHTRVANRQVFS